MATVVLFHHVQGLTEGLQSFAEQVRAGGHHVHTPDFFDGARPASIEEGIALTRSLTHVDDRAAAFVADLPMDLVYAGFSWGGALAQQFAQTRAGARGALLYDAFVGLDQPWSFGPWPAGLRAQVHGMEADPYFALEGDLAAAEAASAEHPTIEVFTYHGGGHLFADSSLPSYDEAAAKLVLERSLAFLEEV